MPEKPWIRPILKRLLAALKWCVRRLPLFSGLPDCNYYHYRDAFKELVVNLIFATSPLWLGSLITFSINTATPKTFSAYWAILGKSVSDGTMLIYATAAIAPLFYFSLTTPKSTRDFPSRLSHIVLGFLIFMVSMVLFGVQRSGTTLDPNFILPVSIVIYISALVMIFVATIYRNWRDAAESDEIIRAAETQSRETEQAFIESAMRHRQ
jgi:hypothetical protein